MTQTADRDTLEHVARALDAATAAMADLDPAARRVATEAVDALNALHRVALTTLVRRLKGDPRGKELLFELVDEPEVRMVLALHGIIRPDPVTVANQVLDGVRVGLRSHGGDVELDSISDGVAYVRLQGACNGCSMAAVTMRNGVESALVAGVPGVTSVEVLPNDPSPTLIPLSSIGVGPPSASVDAELLAAGWCPAVESVDTVPVGELATAMLHPQGHPPVEVVVVNAAGQLAAYVNECAHQGLPLDNALVDADAGTLTCPWHGFCYDSTSGECLTMPGAQLQQLPLRIESGRVWVRAVGG
jgi:nitrite reductase/ring-hydroxylating ferredoxin subunit/Fe-S cluster biogenesis protein NfuA